MGAVKCVLLTWTSTCMKIGVFTYVCFVVCSQLTLLGLFLTSLQSFTPRTRHSPPPLLICASLPMLISFVACTLVTDKYSCLESTINTFFKIRTVYPSIIFQSKLYHPVWVFFVSLFIFLFRHGVSYVYPIPSLLL